MNTPINWYEKDPNEVLDVLYNEIEDDGKRFEFLKQLISNFPDLEIDWLEAFEDTKEFLIKEERIADILFFVSWYSQKFAEDYSRRYEFIERDLCNHFFFKKDFKAIQKRIDFIQQNPVPGIDVVTIPLLYQLIYFGEYQRAVDFAQQVWEPIMESDKLIGNPEYYFINTIYVNKLQEYYESVLNNKSFNVDLMFEEIVALGFDNDKDIFNQVKESVISELNMDLIQDSLKRNKDDHMLHLNIQFMKYMYHEFNLPFVFSELIWQFIATRKIFGKQGKKNWFFIDAKTMDKHIVERYDNFLSSNELEIFGKVWGLDYLTSFFYHNDLITPEQLQIITENNDHFRNEMLTIVGNNLWQMMYVFDWPNIEESVGNDHDPALFKSSFGKDANEVRIEITDYISTFPVNDRIVKELKLDKKKPPLFFPGNQTPIIKDENEVGRNDPCPCGSGKKYKKCCLNK